MTIQKGSKRKMADFPDFSTQENENAPNLENLLQLGIARAKGGNRAGARVLLQQVLDADKQNDRAWLWMAYVTDKDVDRRRFLRTAIRLNPKNQAAKRALDRLDRAQNASKNRTMVYGSMALAGLILFAALACVIALAIS
jgi:hypothetical protein